MGTSLPHLEVVLEDEHVLAVVKPAGLPTANAPAGVPTAYSILRSALPSGGFLGVVSRLDAPVSGVLVMAKTRGAAAELSRQFRERQVSKVYAAVVEGRFPAPLGQWVDWHDRIERRDQERRSRLERGLLPAPRASVRPARGREDDPPDEGVDDEGVDEGDERPGAGQCLAGGAACHVRARVVHRAGEVSLVELEPSTGRRHQLRAQLAAHGCPIVGDRGYGARLPFLADVRTAIALHSLRLSFDHPATGRVTTIAATWPAAWATRFPSLPLGDAARRRSRRRTDGES
jgi:23S rRNA pseudouridine1911/1915/1917 synthase